MSRMTGASYRETQMTKMLILPLQEVNYGDIKLVGGKAASLGEMLQTGIQVPPGFVITTDAYKQGNSKELSEQIFTEFDRLEVERVAVRSSAVAEDSSSASWAGQLESVLNVHREGLVEAVEYCWQSMQSKRARSYAKEQGVTKSQQAVAVVVQAMVNSDVSGVMFTANPINGKRSETVIEVAYGLGELLVQGAITPESYVLDNQTGKIISQTKHRQMKMLVYQNGKNTEVKVTKFGRIITPLQLKAILEQGKRIQKHYGKPQDIEFAIENNKLHIVQSRPITTLSQAGTDLPEFFSHVTKTIARPATLQRDEIVRFTSNAIFPVDVVTLPLEGTTRAYYLEAGGAKKIMQICLEQVATQSKLQAHLKQYQKLKSLAESTCKRIEQKTYNYVAIFKEYRKFLTELSPFLYTGVAVDAVLYPKFKTIIEEKYPDHASRILDIVATPNNFHDYQKLRLAVCKLKLRGAKSKQIGEVVKTFLHVNEYSFIEPLLTPSKVQSELNQLTIKTAQVEIEDIEKSIDSNPASTKLLQKLLPEDLFAQGMVIKEYALLRTDRIDQLKRVQTKLRSVFEQLAGDMTKLNANNWTRPHIANLLDSEIDAFVSHGTIQSFDEISSRLDQKYLYYYTKNKATIVTDPGVVQEALDIVITPENSKTDSLISPGTVAFSGTVAGRVVRITGLNDLPKVKKGDIMVAHVTMPDYTPAMKLAGGFITAQGGVTSHAAIIARELGKPCIVGADNCMDVLKDGDYILLDSSKQIVSLTQQSTLFYLGEPGKLFYWGPSRAKPLYMSDFMLAVEAFFEELHNDPGLPNPAKTLVLFHDQKMVWLSRAWRFEKFARDMFELYADQHRLKIDLKNWHKTVEALDAFVVDRDYVGNEEINQFCRLSLAAWQSTLFAEFSLYGATAILNERLGRINEKDRQIIWGAYTLPDKPLFMQRIDTELAETQDPAALAKKYPWLNDSYSGVAGNTKQYFVNRLKIVQDNSDTTVGSEAKRREIAKQFTLTDGEIETLNLARNLAVFMDDRKAWMMRTRRYIAAVAGSVATRTKTSLSIIEDTSLDLLATSLEPNGGWFYGAGKVVDVNKPKSAELWERYVDFKAYSSVLTGQVASNGGRHFVNGEVTITTSPSDPVADDQILVVPATSPSYVPLMRKARALVTDHGGMMSHAAIVARELGLPCIVGTKQATKVLKNGDKVVLDLVKGEVSK